MIYRQLTIKDLDEYKRVRLELLKNNDESFGSCYYEESAFDLHMWVNRLEKTTVISYGAFDNDKLVGIVVGVMSPRRKMKHAATINSVYVTPDYRGKGIARKLMVDLIELLEERDIEILKLSVVTTNTGAYNLYKSLGFETYGTEAGSIKTNGKYIDQYLMMRR